MFQSSRLKRGEANMQHSLNLTGS